MFQKAIALTVLALAVTATGCDKQSSSPISVGTTGQSLQCHKDTDCKGDRICENGSCTNPAVTSPLLPTQVAAAPAIDESPKATTAAPDTPSATIPKFKDYPSGPVYKGPTAALADKSDDFRTRHSNALAENPIVFASEYVISTIGCGTSCVFQSFLSKRTGEQLKDGFGGEGGEKIKEVRVDSNLVVTAGPNDENENDPNFYTYFYVLENARLKRIAKVQTTLPECEGTDYCTVDTVFFD